MVQFKAEIKEVKAKKLVSGDIEYSVKLVTDNSQILALGVIPADEIVDVDIEGE